MMIFISTEFTNLNINFSENYDPQIFEILHVEIACFFSYFSFFRRAHDFFSIPRLCASIVYINERYIGTQKSIVGA